MDEDFIQCYPQTWGRWSRASLSPQHLLPTLYPLLTREKSKPLQNVRHAFVGHFTRNCAYDSGAGLLHTRLHPVSCRVRHPKQGNQGWALRKEISAACCIISEPVGNPQTSKLSPTSLFSRRQSSSISDPRVSVGVNWSAVTSHTNEID